MRLKRQPKKIKVPPAHEATTEEDVPPTLAKLVDDTFSAGVRRNRNIRLLSSSFALYPKSDIRITVSVHFFLVQVFAISKGAMQAL